LGMTFNRHYQKPNYAVSAISFKSHMNTIKLREMGLIDL